MGDIYQENVRPFIHQAMQDFSTVWTVIEEHEYEGIRVIDITDSFARALGMAFSTCVFRDEEMESVYLAQGDNGIGIQYGGNNYIFIIAKEVEEDYGYEEYSKW